MTSMTLFYELIQVVLGNRTVLSRTPSEVEWHALYETCRKQSVTGVAFQVLDGLSKQKQKPPLDLLYQWIEYAELIKQQNLKVKYPIGMMSIAGRKIAYSCGGYFRLIPYWLISKTMNRRDYDICYFHLNDLIAQKLKLMSRSDYEEYFMQPGTLENRLIRFFKSNAKTGNTLDKLTRLLGNHQFVNLREADKQIDWNSVEIIIL